MKAENVNHILNVIAGELQEVSPQKGDVQVKSYLGSDKDFVAVLDLEGEVHGLISLGLDKSTLNKLENKEVMFQEISTKLGYENKLYIFSEDKKPTFKGWTSFIVNLDTTIGEIEVSISLVK